MPEKHPKANRFETFTQSLTKFSEWHRGIGIILFIFIVALLSRTVDLSAFPYFQSNWPWMGINGLYQDEYYISLLTPSNSLYFPFLQIGLMDLTINVLGYSIFSVRLVSALFSSITCVLVYLSTYEIFDRKLTAFISSLFFIFMTPALVYGRMAFVENGATTFFLTTFLFAVKYLKTSKNHWLVSSGIFAGLSFLCKQTGVAATVFMILLVFIYKPKAKRQLPKAILIAGLIASLYLVQILLVNPGYIGNYLIGNISAGIGNISWLAIFVGNIMPSGVNVMWIESSLALYKDLFRLATLDFWYIFAFFVIIYLMARQRESVNEVVLAIVSYVLVLLLVAHANPYYVILVQPFIAIPFGYGVLKLREMSGVFSCLFALLLCLPAATYIGYYLAYFMIGSTMSVFLSIAQFAVVIPVVVALTIRFWRERIKKRKHGLIERILLIYYIAWTISVGFISIAFGTNIALTSIQFVFVTPVAIVGIVRLIFGGITQKEAININKLLVVFYVGCLIIGSYLLPAFYPGYFAQSTVPT